MSIQKNRRDLFEALFPVPYYITWNIDRSGYYSIHRDSTRKRGAELYDAKWQGFNAALDAVEIELPKRVVDWSTDGWGDGFNVSRDRCKEAIESTGLGLKVKP